MKRSHHRSSCCLARLHSVAARPSLLPPTRNLRRCREDRRHDRHVERLCRRHRERLADRGANGRGGFRRLGQRQEDRNHRAPIIRTSPMSASASPARGTTTISVDAIADVPTSSIALAVSDDHREKNKVFLFSGGGDLRSHRSAMLAEHDPLDLRHLCVEQCRRQGDARARRRHLVLPHRRLRIRAGARARCDERREQRRRQGARLGAPSLEFSSDFASFLVQAQASKAKVIAFANAGGDASNAAKQAN